ncbi:MAG: hypothetical protein ACKVW3_11515 [Phycisphaerales bacterium]
MALSLRYIATLPLLGLVVVPALAIDRTTTGGQFAVRLMTERDEMTVADRLRLEVRVSTPPGARAEIADPGPRLGGFTIVSREPLTPSPSGTGGLTTGLVFTLEPFLAGDYEIPGFSVACTDASGATTMLVTEPVLIPVRSVVGDDEATQPAPIRGIVEPPQRRSTPWLWIAVSTAIATALGGAIVSRNRKLRKEAAPLATALARLEPHRAVAASLNAEQADTIIEALRAALRARAGSGIDSFDSDAIFTVAERSRVLTATELGTLRTLLAGCDALRFGGESVGGSARGDVTAAIAICKALSQTSGGAA